MVFPCGHVSGIDVYERSIWNREIWPVHHADFEWHTQTAALRLLQQSFLRAAPVLFATLFLSQYLKRARAGVALRLEKLIEHDRHRRQHVNYGIKGMLSEIMMLAQPDFITRRTEGSGQKTMEERDQRDVNTALLNAMVLTELEDTVWHCTATKSLAKEQAKGHIAGVRAIEYHLLGLLMRSGKNCRRTW
ncbi:hypothetical protein F4803DRAFT_552683 [Xylaria telfairii]|nr:hypothetical protein F4803DRAFT_552683 [Xylaria telfairii]